MMKDPVRVFRDVGVCDDLGAVQLGELYVSGALLDVWRS